MEYNNNDRYIKYIICYISLISLYYIIYIYYLEKVRLYLSFLLSVEVHPFSYLFLNHESYCELKTYESRITNHIVYQIVRFNAKVK